MPRNALKTSKNSSKNHSKRLSKSNKHKNSIETGFTGNSSQDGVMIRIIKPKNKSIFSIDKSPSNSPFPKIKRSTTAKHLKNNKLGYKDVKSFDDRLNSNRLNPNKIKRTKTQVSLSSNHKRKKSEQSFSDGDDIKGILRTKCFKNVRRSKWTKSNKQINTNFNISANSERSTVDSLTKKPVPKINPKTISSNENKDDTYTGRFDTYGHPIVRGKRRHKILLNLKKKTIEVENWKDLNFKQSFRKKKKSKGCGVGCVLF